MSITSGRRADKVLACVVRGLPDLAGAIEAEYGRSPAFRGLCEDYLLCAEAVAGWEASVSPTAAARRYEYAQWLAELRNEIVEWLGAVPGEAPARGGENP